MERWITDTQPSEKYPVYTRANAGEVIPDPVSPLTATLGILAAGEKGWRDAYVSTGSMDAAEFEDDRPNTIACFGGYLYLNMSLTRIYGVRCPGMTPELVDLQYFGAMPGIPTYESEARPTDESATHTERIQEFLNSYTFGRDDLPELREHRDEVDALAADRPDLASATDGDLVERMRSLLPMYRRLFEEHIKTSASSGLGIGTVAGVCDAVQRPDLTMTLVAGAGDVDSAAPSEAMWDLSRLDPQSNEFQDGLVLFLDRFGARGPNEWELRSHTWGTKPELVLAAIDRMRGAPDSADPRHAADRLRIAREKATAEVTDMLAGNAEALGQFQAGLRASLLFNAGRERTKTNNIKLVHEQRLAARELGQRMAERGAIRSADHVFMLRDEELDDFVAGPDAFAAELADREAQYLELFDLEPPFVLRGSPPPLSEWKHRDRTVTAAAPGTVLHGIPGCAGTAEGRARVILDPSDPSALEPGDVLVAPHTDPAWTPLFVPAAAVVVDVGAQITHAVIVSRELGIPCVVSVTGATRTIPDGARVRVDGAAGTVEIV